MSKLVGYEWISLDGVRAVSGSACETLCSVWKLAVSGSSGRRV